MTIDRRDTTPPMWRRIAVATIFATAVS
ncbi:MAG: hypothetical protein QOD90_5716, partial [Mycobacterium sp.]|nr:hypothetical protein [Mycobacterium sp.]